MQSAVFFSTPTNIARSNDSVCNIQTRFAVLVDNKDLKRCSIVTWPVRYQSKRFGEVLETGMELVRAPALRLVCGWSNSRSRNKSYGSSSRRDGGVAGDDDARSGKVARDSNRECVPRLARAMASLSSDCQLVRLVDVCDGD